MLKIHWFLLLKCEYLLAFLVFYYIKPSIFRFWILVWTKQTILMCQLGLLMEQMNN